MDSGEVAVENSRGIPSFGTLSTSHLKERYYERGSHHHHHRPHPSSSSSSSTMYQGMTSSSTLVAYQQPPIYHRYQANTSTNSTTNNTHVSSNGTVYGPYTYQYPHHTHGRRGLKYYQHYGNPSTPMTTTPSTTNSATQTIAPVTTSFRPKHLRYNPCSMFFTRGHCHYGTNCKFSHDVNSLRASQKRFVVNSKAQSSPETIASAPLSAPAVLNTSTGGMDSSQRYKWSNAVNGKSNHEELNSHDDEQFPQLRGKTRVRSMSTSNQSPERSHKATSPFKKMVFRDAVLKQKSDDDGEVTPDCSSSTKSSVNSDGDDSSETPEDEVSNTNSPSRQSNSSFPQRFPHRSGYGRIHPSVDTWSGDVNENGARYSRHMARSTDNNYFYRGNHLRYPNGTIQNTPQQPQLVHPQMVESEHVGYVVHPDYSTSTSSIGFGSGVDLGYSMLSTQANEYVEKLDAQLLALEPFHQSAITSLQELARSIWGDAVLEIYGSNYTRLALPKSDVDCVLVSQEAASEEPSSVLRRLSEELKVQEWAIHVDLLDSAKIPVLKIVYKSESSGGMEVMLDVTCGHSTGHSGLSARDIIYSYQNEMPALRPLVLILKSHIQSSGLNCAFTGGLSSYALVLLAIRFLQACGDEHYRTYDGATFPSGGHVYRGRSYSEGGVSRGETLGVTNSDVDGMETSSNWIYVFTRDGKVMWRTGLGNLLLLFLETYITFDYRHYGISIENTGEYFALPAEKVTLEPGAVVVPYIVDPIKPNRSIGNCFRMHEIIQVWYVLYQSIASGVPLEDALNASVRPV